MLKKLYFLAFCLLAACSSIDNSRGPSSSLKKGPCPNVEINRSEAYLSQTEGYKNRFKIEIYGYDGYCWFDAKINRPKATIVPLFNIIRLDNSTDEGHVDFDWYYRTSEGPTAFLGYKTFSETTKVPDKDRVYKFRGRQIDVRVPTLEDSTFTINLGVKLNNQEKLYNNVTFDLN